jgi:hypothetical protein
MVGIFLGLIQLAFVNVCQAAGTFIAYVADAAGQPVSDAVVSLDALNFTPPAFGSGAPHAIVDQRSRRFVPHVLPVQVGTSVDLPNSDNIQHRVYSFSKLEHFELPLYKGSNAAPVTFDVPRGGGAGPQYADWMLGYIYRGYLYFGKTDADGNLRIETLPAGRYQVQLWQPRAAQDESRVMDTVLIKDSVELKRRFALELCDESADGAPPPWKTL